LVVASLYLALAALSGHLSILARRPLLDGFSNQVPYRWVNPPPQHRAGNQPPLSGRFNLSLNPGSGSQPGVFSTRDLQVSVVFSQGSFPATPGQQSVSGTMTPLDPARYGAAPAGLAIAGNVYALKATDQPSGQPVTGLSASTQLALAYPAAPNPSTLAHVILFSPSGRDWKALKSTDSPAQQVSANITALGFFAVGQRQSTGTASHSRSALIPTILIAVLVFVVALLIVRYEVRERRRRRLRQPRGGSHGRRSRRPPPPSDRR